MRYLHTWFAWDILGFFPFYFVAMAAGVNRSQAVLLLAFQMLKLVRYFSFWKEIEVYFTRNQMDVSSAVLEISKVIILIVILLVVFGCVLITIGCPNHENAYCNFGCTESELSAGATNCTDTESWMEAGVLPSDIEHNFMHQINGAVYVVAQALYTIGYGDVTVSTNSAEKIFTTIMMLVGSFSFAVTIAVMSSVIANQDILYMEFRQNMESLSEYMHHHAMPHDLQQKLQNHFSYLYAMQYGKLELDILGHLPKSLRSEVMKLNIPLLESHPFCKGTNSINLVEELAKLLKPRTYSPNETVVVRDAPVMQICLIRNGKVNVVLPSDDKSTLMSLLSGDHFGTFEFFFGTPSEYAYVTASFTELLSLERKDFEQLMMSPMFDSEARSIDFTVQYIMSEIFPSAIGRQADGQDSGTTLKVDEDVAPKEFIGELKQWSRSQSIINSLSRTTADMGIGGTRSPQDRRTFFAESPPEALSPSLSFRSLSNTSSKRQRRPSYQRESSNRSASSIDEDGEGEMYHGIVLCFFDWREQKEKRKEKVAQMMKNIGKKNKFSDMMNEIDDGGEAPKGVILANSLLREAWDVTILVSTMWMSLVIPYRLYVQARSHGNPWGEELGFGIFVDWIFDVFGLINILLNARYFATTEINENGKQINITDKDMIFYEYRETRFMMDVTIAIPYDFLGFVFGGWNFCRVPKLLAAFRLPYLVGRMKEHLSRHKIHITLDTVLAINLTIATIVFTHWSSCVWGMMGENFGEENGGFVASVYFSLTTMTTVGFGDITPVSVNGRWFGISMMILGSCFTAGVIANITAMAHKIEISEDNAQHVTTCVEKYMLEKELPHNIVERAHRYFQMLHHMHDGAKIEKNLIPPAFLPVIAKHNHNDLILSTSIFSVLKGSSGLMQR